MKLRTRPVVSFSLIGVVAVSLIVSQCKFSFAEVKKPARESVKFGAENKPQIKSSTQLEAFKNVFADIAEKTIPTVVSITATQVDTIVFMNNPYYNSPFNQFFGDQEQEDSFTEFFGMPPPPRGRQQLARPENRKQARRSQGLGSGVIVSKDGYILTNFHVVAGATEIEVKLSDGRKFLAVSVGSDSLTDVAVIKLKESVANLPVAYLGNSDRMRAGDWVIAIGNPFNFTSTVTTGIVSALGRQMNDGGAGKNYQNFIQTDAAINPGNSGGALVNLDGELIGINTMIASMSGGFMGIGFAIPINMAQKIMEDLIYDGKVSRGFLGVQIQTLTDETRRALELDPGIKGAVVTNVSKGQPADKAGIKSGDIITAIDGKKVESSDQLRFAVASIRPESNVSLAFVRNGSQMSVTVKLGSLDKKGVDSFSQNPKSPAGNVESVKAAEKIGISVSALTADMADNLGIDKSTKGVLVTGVQRGSQAQEVGLAPKDLIIQVNKRPIASLDDFNKALGSVKEGSPLLFVISRSGTVLYISFVMHE